MQQLYFVRKGKLEWREVKTPTITANDDVLVRPFAVAKCDLDDAFLFNHASLKIKIGQSLGLVDPYFKSTFGNLLKGPFPFGHECVGQVIDIGDDIRKIKRGDVVTVPFQISCGTCHNCKQGFTATCDTVAPISTYGFGKHLEFGGAMSDVIKVPYGDHMLNKIPEGIDPIALASLSDNIPDAYRHIEDLVSNPNQSVLIISDKAKSVGIYALIMAKALNTFEIDYVDSNIERLNLAETLGANKVYKSFKEINKRYDIVIDASATQQGLNQAFKSVRNYGTVSSSGIYIKKTSISLIQLYTKGVNFKIGLVNARASTAKVLELIKTKNIDFGTATTKLDTWQNAIDAFLTDTTKVIVFRKKIDI